VSEVFASDTPTMAVTATAEVVRPRDKPLFLYM